MSVYQKHYVSVNKDNEKEEEVLKIIPLDKETLMLLGEKTSSSENNDLFLYPEVEDRWQVWSQDGLKKRETRIVEKTCSKKKL